MTSTEHALKAILGSGQVPADLAIVYNDMHGLWGGSSLTLRGDGWLERQVRPPGAQAPTGSHTQVSRDALLKLIGLLVDLAAWEQRTQDAPDRPPLPDESRSYLTIDLDGHKSVVWERFNDMASNGRLIRVKRWLESRFGNESANAGQA